MAVPVYTEIIHAKVEAAKGCEVEDSCVKSTARQCSIVEVEHRDITRGGVATDTLPEAAVGAITP